tara:strand:+ start:21 stop:614 length:594 start_codon:yes stop_codon:yes gene_type:complete
MTAKIKLNSASGGGSFSLQAPSSSANNRVFTLPDVADATMATVNGISEFDQWYLTADKTSDGDLTSNLSRNNLTGAASQIGTGMEETSGIFKFPRTGKYLVICNGVFECAGSDSVFLTTNVTINNSSYVEHTRATDGNNGTGGRRGSGTSFAFLDVTDIDQVKVKFTASSLSSGSNIRGATNTFIRTGFIFIRLGDT